jgi:hypothetical protein
MGWVAFHADYDHRVGGSIVAYKAGHTLRVPSGHAAGAVAAGRAQRLSPPATLEASRQLRLAAPLKPPPEDSP